MAIVTISRLHKIALLSLGAIRSLRHCHIDKLDNRYVDVNPWTRNYVPSMKWDYNWDYREPKSLVKPPEPGNPEDEKRYNEEIEKERCKSVHHLFLIRSAQYIGEEVRYEHLTELGKQQAELTGKRLDSVASLDAIHFTSSIQRAVETSNIIMKQYSSKTLVFSCKMLAVGIPIPSEPPSKWTSDGTLFHDSARLEAAFRIYFHRDWPSQKDRYTIIVCHNNAIRYFACRALQFPPEGWSRMSLNHCSITSLSILPNGEVVLRSLNDTAHLEPKYITN